MLFACGLMAKSLAPFNFCLVANDVDGAWLDIQGDISRRVQFLTTGRVKTTLALTIVSKPKVAVGTWCLIPVDMKGMVILASCNFFRSVV
jgi:hypothetical protein